MEQEYIVYIKSYPGTYSPNYITDALAIVYIYIYICVCVYDVNNDNASSYLYVSKYTLAIVYHKGT